MSERTPEGYNITQPKFRGSLVDQFNAAIARNVPARTRRSTTRARCSSSSRAAWTTGSARASSGSIPAILSRGAILYIKVSFEESFRRNSARYKPGQEESHPLPQGARPRHARVLPRQRLGRASPTARRTAGCELRGVRVPFVSMNNEPESTDPAVLRERYARALGRLLHLYRTR